MKLERMQSTIANAIQLTDWTKSSSEQSRIRRLPNTDFLLLRTIWRPACNQSTGCMYNKADLTMHSVVEEELDNIMSEIRFSVTLFLTTV